MPRPQIGRPQQRQQPSAVSFSAPGGLGGCGGAGGFRPLAVYEGERGEVSVHPAVFGLPRAERRAQPWPKLVREVLRHARSVLKW